MTYRPSNFGDSFRQECSKVLGNVKTSKKEFGDFWLFTAQYLYVKEQMVIIGSIWEYPAACRKPKDI
jgi:hypothetical protein